MTPQSEAPGPPQRARHSGLPLGALVLIGLGIILVLQTTGVVSWELWSRLWQFWPIIIIAIGLDMLLGRRAPWLAGLLVAALLLGAVLAALALAARGEARVVSTLAEPLSGVRSAHVQVAFGPGELIVRALPAASTNLVEGRFETPGQEAQASLKRSGESAELRLASSRRSWFGGAGARWELALSPAPRLSLELDAGASDIRLDLRDLQVSSLDIDAGAARLDLIVPASAGEVRVAVKAGAADITVTVPEGVAARISRSSGVSTFDVDSARFPAADGAHVSPGFEGARNRVSLDFRVGAASVSVR